MRSIFCWNIPFIFYCSGLYSPKTSGAGLFSTTSLGVGIGLNMPATVGGGVVDVDGVVGVGFGSGFGPGFGLGFGLGLDWG